MTDRHARAFRPARCNLADERLEIVHQGAAVGSIIVSEDHENPIVAAARLQTAAHVEEIAGAAVFGPPQRTYGTTGQRGRDQVCLDLIVRNEPKPNINQPTMPAVIAPASVASICAVVELLRAGG
jgi:hypothetical protein